MIRGHCCKPTMALMLIVAALCSSSNLCFYCFNTVLQQWPVSQCCNTFNNCLSYHCCSNTFKQLSLFRLLQQCVPIIALVPIVVAVCSTMTMTPSHARCLVLGEKRDRQTDRQAGARKVFFAHAVAWRQPNNCDLRSLLESGNLENQEGNNGRVILKWTLHK